MSSPIERNQRPTFLPPFMSGEPETRSDSGKDDGDNGNFVGSGGAGGGAAEERRETREMDGGPWGESNPGTGHKRSEASSQPLATKENKGKRISRYIFIFAILLLARRLLEEYGIQG